MTKADKILNKHLTEIEAKYIADKRFLYESLIDAINEALDISSVSSSKRFCTTDLLNAYQAGAGEMYNKIVNSIQKQTLKGLKEDSQEWLKLYDK